MSTSVGEGRQGPALLRVVLFWGAAALLVVVAFVVTVVTLNATLYSASGFARSYVAAVDRGDVQSALAYAGVEPSDADGDALLAVPSRGGLDDVRAVDDVPLDDGTHAVTLGYTVDGEPAQSQFVVQQTANRFGLFRAWRFAQAPVASLDVTPQHDPRFRVDGRTVTAAQADVATRYVVLAPATFEIDHESTWLTAERQRVAVPSVGGTVAASVATEAKDSFVETVQGDLDRFLDEECLPQRVLLPAGCPFGRQVDDRLLDEPVWTMPVHPVVEIVPAPTPGQWQVPAVPGTAHLEVPAQRLFDGTLYTVDDDVPYTVSYLITIGTDDALAIEAQ